MLFEIRWSEASLKKHNIDEGSNEDKEGSPYKYLREKGSGRKWQVQRP